MPEENSPQENEQPDKQLTKHEKRLLRHRGKKESGSSPKSAKKGRGIIKYALFFIILLAISYTVFPPIQAPANLPPEKPADVGGIHWQADLSIYLCGQERKIPGPVSGRETLGTAGLYTKADLRIYKEANPADTLGMFFDAIGVRFSNDKIFELANGNGCNDGKDNKVLTLVNGNNTEDGRNYNIQNRDKIEIKYE